MKNKLVIGLILFFNSTSWGQLINSFITSQQIQPPANEQVGKYKKLEFGFKFAPKIQSKIDQFIVENDTSGINPYDPEQLNFEADFISPTGIHTKRYGFYYRPYKANTIFDRWEEDTTSWPFRVRFSPDEIGKWKVKIEIYTKRQPYPINHELEFICTESDHKGTLKVSKTDSDADRYLYYSETGEPFLSISNNISSGGFLTYLPSQNRDHLKGVQQLIDVGGNFTRFDMQPQAGLPDWPNIKNYSGKLDEMFAFDKMVELCENNGVYFIAFRHHVELIDSYFNPGGSDWSGVSWYDNPYRSSLHLRSKKEYLTNEEAIKWQLNSLRYVFSRWGYSPSFSFYGYSEINNWYSGIIKEEQKENPKFDDSEAITLFKNWFVNQQNYIQSNLSKKILYSNSYSNIPKAETNSNFEGLFKHSDVISIHDYATNKDGNYKNRYNKIDEFWNLYKKPVILEEMGISDNKLRIYCCTGIEYHNSIWASSMMGSIGTGMDWWWNRGVHDFGYHLGLKQVQSFFEGEDLRKGVYSPQKWSESPSNNKRTLENIALVSENKERALGWIHNATFYWRNLEKESPCIQELISKSKLTYPCFVVGGYDINNEGPGDYDRKSYEDDYTCKGGAQEIKSSTNFLDNPTFELTNLKSSFGSRKNWYKIEFYATNGKKLELINQFTQVVSSTIFSKIKIHTPDLDKINPDYSYKVSYLGKYEKNR